MKNQTSVNPIPLSVFPGFLFLISFCLVITSFNATSSELNNKLSALVPGSYIPGELLVKFREPITDSVVQGKSRFYKARVKSRNTTIGYERWKIGAQDNLLDVINELKTDPSIAIVEPNYRRFPRIIRPSSAENQLARLQQVKLPQLWEIEKAQEREFNQVKIAIIDDGFYIAHTDLEDNIDKSNAFDAENNTFDPSPNTCVDFSTQETITETHGTQVLGVVGAVVNNGFGIDGAADNASMIPIRISCNYSVDLEQKAFNHAISKNVDIINISWGGPQFSEIERLMILNLLKENILIITAAGNNHADNDRVLDYPSGLNLPNILAVAATDEQNELIDWSQWGQTTVDIAAPGTNFYTTIFTSTGNSFKAVAGTSFSAPLVAGVVASIMQRIPSASVMDVKGAIMATAVPFASNTRAKLATDGYVDAFAAYLKFNEPIPVPVIEKIVIDDESSTANNGEIDPGETANLIITIQNVWHNASFLQADLLSDRLGGFVGTASTASLNGFDSTNFTYGSADLSYPIDFSNLRNRQNIEFELQMSGTYSGAKTYELSRYFTLDVGKLENNNRVVGVMRKNGDIHDEAHYYHIELEEDMELLEITLDTDNGVDNTIRNLDLLVNYGSQPQFDYLEGFDKTSKVSASKTTNIETVTYDQSDSKFKPKAGIYHIVVFEPESQIESGQGDHINYQLIASYSSKSTSRATSSGGCTVANKPIFDPVLILLCLFPLIRFANIALQNRKQNILNRV